AGRCSRQRLRTPASSPCRTAWLRSNSEGRSKMTSTQDREQAAAESLVISLDEYIRARYGLIAVQTFEEERFLRFMRGVAEHDRHRAKGLYCWSRTRVLRSLAGPGSTTEPRVLAGTED